MNKVILSAAMILISTACSSKNDDNSGSVVGLSLPQKITAMSAQSGTGLQNNQIMASAFFPATFDDPITDFSNDKVQSWVFDDSTDSIKLVNYFLCFLNKLEYQAMVNKGAYIAAVNYGQCYEEAFANNNITIPDPIIKATVVSSRKDNNSAHIVKAWFSDNDATSDQTQNGLVPKQTLLEIIINRESNESNPFGDFILSFASVEDASNHGGTQGEEFRTDYGTYRASLNASGQPTFKIINTPNPSANNESNYYHNALTLVIDNSSEESGAVHSHYKYNPDDPVDASMVQFNSNRALKGKYNSETLSFETQQCFSRDETRRYIYSYNLYHKNDGVFRGEAVTSGQRVEINSSFSFDYNGISGWMSEDNYWLDNDGKLPNGATITKLSYFGDEDQQLSVFTSPGKFTRYQSETVLLASLQNMDFYYYGSHPVSGVNDSWILRLTTSNDFNIVRKQVWTGSEYIESESYDDDNDTSTPEVPVEALISFENISSINFYDKLYYNNYKYTFDPNLLPEERFATLKTDDIVNASNGYLFPPATTEVTLYCYEKCPKGGLTQETVTNATGYSDIFYNYFFDATPVSYTAKLEGYRITLIDDSNSLAVDASNLDLSKSSLYLYSIRSGGLVTQPLDLPANSTQLSEAPLSYIWETSNDSYHQSFVLLDENSAVYNFDKRLNIEYTYDAAHDLYNTDPETNPFHGSTFNLTYSHTGFLWGFPYIEDESNNLHMTVNIAAGTEMSNAEGDYVVKAVWEIQYMLEKDISECTGLDVETLLDQPSMNLLTLDDVHQISFSAADKPIVSDGPAVRPGD